jgi:hypothetical protein
MTKLLEYGGDIFLIMFVAFFVLSIVVGVIQHRKGEELWEAPMPVLAVLAVLWVAFVISIFAWMAISVVSWVVH